MQIDLTAGVPTQLPVTRFDRVALVNEGPGRIRFARTSAATATGLPLAAGVGYEFPYELSEAGWPTIWVVADADATVTFDTVG